MVIPINHLPGGKKLPMMSNPAAAAQIFAGYEAINQAGEVMVGTASEGMKMVKGSFTSSSTNNGLVTINVGFKPEYIVMQWGFRTTVSTKALLFYITSGLTDGSVVYADPDNVYGGKFSSSYYFIQNITDTGFDFRSYVDYATGKAISYWVFG